MICVMRVQAEEAQGLEQNIRGSAYYVPHSEVIREDSVTTKLRVVFDASSHAKGVRSLNSWLEIGPNLNPDLLQVLLRFRFNLVPMTADIENAFLQVDILIEDRDMFRFLWFDETPDIYFKEEVVELGKVPEVYSGADGVVRACSVHLPGGKASSSQCSSYIV
ncbi:hypothetical protein HPB50_026728 [Hyalomma asiaticum]|uniref:Uncharacterized protein n=1 Tax=Hyalomma asiaticum TaxID=266040 RepID=A0ACB7STH2_HYAAI|nr:hypothetical protein HPB50_026728 [Hyalomma asiaticum]